MALHILESSLTQTATVGYAFTAMDLPSEPATLVTTSTTLPHGLFIKKTLIKLSSSITSLLPHRQFILFFKWEFSENPLHEYAHMLCASGHIKELPPGSLLQHMLDFPFVKEFVIQRVASAIDDASSKGHGSAKGDGDMFVDAIKAALYQMVGYHLRLGQSVFPPGPTSFKFFRKLPPELQKMIWDCHFCLPYPLVLLCTPKLRSIDEGYYGVNSGNFAEFMTLDKANVAKITDLKVKWVTTRGDLPNNYHLVRNRVVDSRTPGATMESSNNLKSITLDLSRDGHGCAYYLWTMIGMILAPNSKISSVAVIFRAYDPGSSYASYGRRWSVEDAITQQLGFYGTSFTTRRKTVGLFAICWEGDTIDMKESVKRNAAYGP